MSDRWKDIRDNINELHEIDAEGERFFYVTKVESLLADADALLALVIPAQEAFDYFEADYNQPEWFEALERALAGLSPHLKGE